ncbi:MAG TPA: hypothetical protein VFH08_04525, partial [Chitinophagaceae bacterium]|nr:hypothetical protein [Chitinophagaceae bacterium]
FFFLFAGLYVNVFATVRTVSNSPGTLAQYTTIQAAVTASVNGDTIYVHGSSVTYSGFNITDKRLVVIGPGFSPMQSFMPYPATVSDLTINGSGSSNTEIQGLNIIGAVSITSFSRPDNLRFIRNRLTTITMGTGTATYSGYVFESNWFDNSGLNVAQSCFYSNFLIKNNVFYGNNATTSVSGFYNSVTVIFDHNLFYGPSNGVTNVFGGNCRGLLLTNNIFVRRNAAASNTNSVFHKNITFNAGVDNPWDAAYGNSGSGNIANQDPQMTDQSAVNNGTNNPLLNFTIATGPANNIGTDDKDLGLLFDLTGSLNWTNSRMSRLPFVYSMNISNPSIPAGSILNVQVEARKNN